MDEVEDAAQQVFLSAHRAFLRGAEPKDPRAWLTTIARNECLARIQDRTRRPPPFADAGNAASTGDPVVEAIRRADMTAVWRAVRALAPRQREAMLLREFGGLSYDELAVALGVSLPAVESLLFRARARLRVKLKGFAAIGSLLPRLLTGGGAAKVAGVTMAAGLVGGSVVATERSRHHASAATHHGNRPLALRGVQPAPAAPAPARARAGATAFERRVEEPSAKPTEDTTTTSAAPATGSEDRAGGDRVPVVETATGSPTATVSSDGSDAEPPSDATTTTTTSTEPEGGTDASTTSTDGVEGGGTTTTSGDGLPS